MATMVVKVMMATTMVLQISGVITVANTRLAVATLVQTIAVTMAITSIGQVRGVLTAQSVVTVQTAVTEESVLVGLTVMIGGLLIMTKVVKLLLAAMLANEEIEAMSGDLRIKEEVVLKMAGLATVARVVHIVGLLGSRIHQMACARSVAQSCSQQRPLLSFPKNEKITFRVHRAAPLQCKGWKRAVPVVDRISHAKLFS
jgi:hypothetical protein